MTNIEKIRQEIERLNDINKRIAKEQGCTDFIKGITAGYLEILSFIDSLPDEDICKDSLHIPETCKDNQDSFTSLEEAAAHYEKYNRQSILSSVDIVDAFIAGAKWMKEQMMKEAVEGVVYRYESFRKIATAIIVDIPREILGNKVKLIIVKEDDTQEPSTHHDAEQ